MGYIIRCLEIPFRIDVLVADLCNWVLNNFENDLHRQFSQDVLLARRITTIANNIFPERHLLFFLFFPSTIGYRKLNMLLIGNLKFGGNNLQARRDASHWHRGTFI
jgi:hypothetical protein